jgi:hypoxanthine-guanine phosphoribosyltransferase
VEYVIQAIPLRLAIVFTSVTSKGVELSSEVDQTHAIKLKNVSFKSRPVLEDIVDAGHLNQTDNLISSLRKWAIT